MKLKEAIELLLEISNECRLKEPKKGLFMAIHAQPNGYISIIDQSVVDESAEKCIRSITEKKSLKIKKSGRELVISEITEG